MKKSNRFKEKKKEEKKIKNININSCTIIDTNGNYYFIKGKNLKDIESKFNNNKAGYFIREIIPTEEIAEEIK